MSSWLNYKKEGERFNEVQKVQGVQKVPPTRRGEYINRRDAETQGEIPLRLRVSAVKKKRVVTPAFGTF